jgi:hypothetical protein
MQKPLITIFENEIKSRTGFDFQNFIVQLFFARHGVKGFIPIRRVKDCGCDGIISDSDTVIACYGSMKYDKSDALKKIRGDYKEYETNWKQRYPNWMFIVNHQITPDEINQVQELHNGALILGIEQIMHIINFELKSYKQRVLAQYLQIDTTQYFRQEYIADILTDLLKGTKTDPDNILRYNAIDYVEKIKINYSQLDVEAAINEFETVLVEFTKIANILKNYDSDEQVRIKSRIQSDYKNANGTFKERLAILIENYLRQYANENDDDYRYYITSVLLYHFEQCIIGIKTKNEIKP